jgi:dienelactone hydrolase/predicted Ser/Thr protein kinase
MDPSNDQTGDTNLLVPGAQIGPYKIEAVLGSGGMGQVFRVRDTRLGRIVAIKLIRPDLANKDDFRHRFKREARAISSLNHPHICSLHDIGEQNGSPYLVMEYVEGETLAAVLKGGPLSLDRALTYGAQVAEALASAHAQGIVHRDLKPGNIMITSSGVKVLDFGLAKRAESSPSEGTTDPSLADETQEGHVMGTVAYMSPEQAEGKPVDARSDMFSLGVVLYEMICGRRPFHGDTTLSTLAAILRADPEHPRKLRHDIPEQLERIVLRCLSKNRADRYASGTELRRDLDAYQNRKPRATGRQKSTVAALLVAALVVAGVGAFLYSRAARRQRVETETVPQIASLLETRRPVAALRLLRRATEEAPTAPSLVQLKARLVGTPIKIETTPPGAKIYLRDYVDDDDGDLSNWELIGSTPIETSEMPQGLYRIKAVREGSAEAERAATLVPGNTLRLNLSSPEETPANMVRVARASREAGGFASFPVSTSVEVPEFWLDKYEVTNAQFKAFVGHGGYEKKEYWKHPFVKDGKLISREAAMLEFKDATGLSGPATWQLGTYPEGQADYPVSGVSWYEAAAYAEFVGKALPTAYHWYRAAGVGGFSEVLRRSNFGSQSSSPIGKYRGLGPFGTYDMAGNVKEWSSSPAGDRFYILGGGWNEQSYLFSLPDARKPMDRASNFGFRCAKYLGPIPSELTGAVPFVSRDRRSEKPAADAEYEIYLRLHSYDKTDLKASVDSTDDSSPYWRAEKISLQAAYGNERVIAYLYLPKNASPPYQLVTYFPGANTLVARSVQELGGISVEFLMRSGRAMVLPAYKGTLDRGPSEYYHQLGRPGRWTEMNLQWSKDLGRVLDYLQTRDEIDVSRLAYMGVSLGSAMSPRLIAVEPRFKAAVLFSVGTFEKVAAEVDAWNFAPRVKVPLLMLNGKDDFRFPLETSQRPLFKAIGTPDKDKHLVLYDGGHDTVTRLDAIKEALDWLDRYLGRVKAKP